MSVYVVTVDASVATVVHAVPSVERSTAKPVAFVAAFVHPR